MRIFFILPDQRRATANFSTFSLPGLNVSHIGTLIIGEMLRRKGHYVRIFEEKITQVKLSQLKGADLIGISIQTLTANRGYELAFKIRKYLKIPVVLGGVHATLNTEEALKWGDFVIRNEGEYTMLELVEAIEEGGGYDDILGLSYNSQGETYNNPQRPFIKNLDELPAPNWGLVENMNTLGHTPLNYFLHITQVSRGCPFNCTFCSITPTFGKPFRFRSIESVIEELKHGRLPSQKYVFFYDDNIVANRKYVKDLLSAMIDNNCVPAAWHSQMRADASEDDELMELIKETNCAIATFGFESINPATLKSLQKGQNVDLIKNAIQKFHDANVLVNGFFVFGSENDTVQTIHQTAQFAIDSKIDFLGFMPLTPFPGTPFFDEMKDRIFTKNWDLYDVQHVVFYPEKMSPLELYLETLKGYAKFYRPAARHLKWIKGGGIFNLIFLLWPIRGKVLYRREMSVNRDYVKYLKNLPPYSPEIIESIPEFTLNDENYIRHYRKNNIYIKKLLRKLSGAKHITKIRSIDPIIKK